MITVLGISGSMRLPNHTHTLVEIALGAARDNGARGELLDLRMLDLPTFDPSVVRLPASILEMRERVADAHAYIIGTPEYHGSVSGAVKNFLDYLYPEVNGKLFGLVVATGGDCGASALMHLRDMTAYLHAWSLPYAVAAQTVDFDASGRLINTKLSDRALRLGRDVAVYGEILYDRFTRDRVPDGGPHLGYAPWHARA